MPGLTEVRFSPLLTNVAIAYMNDMYIQDELFPIVPSKNDSGYYFERGREHFRVEDTKRAKGTPAKKVDYTATKHLYYTDEHALREVVDLKTQNNSPDPLKPLVDATEDLAERMKLAKEKACIDLITSTTTFASYYKALAAYNSVSNPTFVQMDDYTNADPYYIVSLIKTIVLKNSGRMPNVIVMNPELERVIANHPKVKARSQYVRELNEDTLPDTWNGLRVIRSRAVYDSSVEGETESRNFLMGYNYLFIGYITPSPGVWKASVGFTFEHQPLKVKRWWDELIDSTHIQLGFDYTLEVTSARCGYLLTSCLAANPVA